MMTFVKKSCSTAAYYGGNRERPASMTMREYDYKGDLDEFAGRQRIL